MFAQHSTFQLGLVLRDLEQCPRLVSRQRFLCTRIECQAVSAAATCRVGLLRQCTRRYHRLQNREEAGGCGRRLTAAQVASKRADVQLPLAHWLYGLTWSCGFTVQSAIWSCAAEHWGYAQSVSQKTTCTKTTPCSSTSRTKVRFVSHLQSDCACYIVCFTAFTKLNLHGPDVDGASQQREPQSQQQQKRQSRQPRLGGRRHTEVTPAGAASANVSQQQSSRNSEQRHSNHQLADAKAFALRVGDSDESGDSGSEDGMSTVGRD